MKLSFFVVVIIGSLCIGVNAFAEVLTDIPPKEKCRVCGMFVAKYQPWITQLETAEGHAMFDGVKDMMVYYFNPEKYGGSATIKNVYVKDYYSLKYIDGKKAFYVTGSDVLGPMGHEFIPFESLAGAENFKKDHHGDMIFTFDEITQEKLESIRSGM